MLWGKSQNVSLLHPFYYSLLFLRGKLPRLWMGAPCSLGGAIIPVEEGLAVETIIGGNVLQFGVRVLLQFFYCLSNLLFVAVVLHRFFVLSTRHVVVVVVGGKSRG